MRKNGARLMVGAALAGLALAAVPTNAAHAVPVQGTSPWSVLLCKVKDVATEPNTKQFYADMLTSAGKGKGGVQDYFDSQSGGRLWLGPSSVSGWHTMTLTKAEASAKGRPQKIQACINAAQADGYTVPAGNRILVATNAGIGAGATGGGRVLMGPGSTNVGFAAHEMLHSYGLGHSFSDDTTYQNASWSKPGQYDDPWDEMSAMNIHAFTTATFGTSAVGLNAYHRDKLGWLPRAQVMNLGATSRTVTLAPLEDLTSEGKRLVRIPFDEKDPHHYYTVEFRTKTAWSAGIPGNAVLIHEIKDGLSYLLRSRTDRTPVQTLNANGVTIKVGAIGADTASVQVTSTNTVEGVFGPNTCKEGFVWRQADGSDNVCVTPTTRDETADDNTSQVGRRVPGLGCKPFRYVERDAFHGDDTCVSRQRREQALADNAAAAGRTAQQ